MGFTFSSSSSQVQQQPMFVPSNSSLPHPLPNSFNDNQTHNTNTKTTSHSNSNSNSNSNAWAISVSVSPSHKQQQQQQQQFHKQIDPIIPWTSAIARHSRSGNLSSAISEFTRMRLSGVPPNHITFITLLSAIPPLQTHHHLAASIHAYARKLGLDRPNVMLGTALLHLYSKSGLLGEARRVFDELFNRNSVSWNTMIDAYMRNGNLDDALQLFDEMPVSLRDTVSWTVLIGGFVKKGLDDTSLECFCEMQISGVHPDYVTLISVLSACANLGALSLGLWVNRFAMRNKNNLMDNIKLCNTLIDMYSRCGRVDFACQIFENMPSHSLVSWNSMIGGFAANGCVEEALSFFDRMQDEGFNPDGFSFTGALTACSHAGFIDKGLNYFDDMQRVHNISPRIEHYGCLVDLYSRAGRLEDAFNVVQNMPMKPNEVVLGSLLAACRDSGDMGLAEMVMKLLVEVDPRSDYNYVMLANIYAANGSWEGAGKVRRKMKNHGIQKKPGVSSIEIQGEINEFVAGDRSHSEADSIYEILELLSGELGMNGYSLQTLIPEF